MSHVIDQISGFLSDKNNKKYHYNDYEELDYKIPSGSLNLDLALTFGIFLFSPNNNSTSS